MEHKTHNEKEERQVEEKERDNRRTKTPLICWICLKKEKKNDRTVDGFFCISAHPPIGPSLEIPKCWFKKKKFFTGKCRFWEMRQKCAVVARSMLAASWGPVLFQTALSVSSHTISRATTAAVIILYFRWQTSVLFIAKLAVEPDYHCSANRRT